MPLNPATFQAGVQALVPVGSFDTAVDRWADVARDFFAEMVVPPPTGLALGVAAFKSAMRSRIEVDGLGALADGLAAFAAALAGTAAPPAVPPPSPLVVTMGPPTADVVLPAQTLASAVFAWAKTGTWTVPPSGPLPWT